MSSRKIKLMQGNEACVEGALYAGMKFYAGYPITPSTEIAEISAQKLPYVGGKFIQMEDEIAGIATAIGGSIAGLKSMTATSGPGFSLKQENIGYAAIAEVPLVIVNVQRGGPSTGLPTAPAQGDVMQAMWGTHGDHPVIAICPSSVKETFYETVRAFNLAEKYRMPVILLTDEVVGHMRESIEIPEPGEIEIYDRLRPETDDQNYLPYGVNDGEIVGRMAGFGEGHRYHITGLFHDETGFPSNSTKNAGVMLDHLMSKISNNTDEIITFEEYLLEDAETVVLSYGSTARSARSAVNKLRAAGHKVGMFRPITIWPFPEKQVVELSKRVKNIVVAEMNLGQLVLEVQRVVEGRTKVHHIGKANGEVVTPIDIIKKVEEVL
ncbi:MULTISPECIES: 2-oxoacid:acceptor oxidoreductase subunit alpha [unclassified Fusibacter]|uniref:2-oxoacid:acceptor oxidoreductase subunit alpha n=1 Tax=unclassified Fusibacter TaxID=2624464 RepID=UPI001013BF9F|nr:MULTISPECIES: 2-oxoacid:acceptor oxidoreductase subunit alpha [unclassified Fusibacter]MCK8058819.1 2-oxoacid:acceptor oxidoreductase subunit alpha [Fusibacter sp. A2]NPE21893.1 2-oxoacid:acceptor oxidoreductase subunit alpha [Fusibacter sp. A1]RXV61464.1 2-oxoacid:acceptor oxidoreductase subunit alpha [Fusibacter sp. A1]